jgi:hypothetical protein
MYYLNKLVIVCDIWGPRDDDSEYWDGIAAVLQTGTSFSGDPAVIMFRTEWRAVDGYPRFEETNFLHMQGITIVNMYHNFERTFSLTY